MSQLLLNYQTNGKSTYNQGVFTCTRKIKNLILFNQCVFTCTRKIKMVRVLTNDERSGSPLSML